MERILLLAMDSSSLASQSNAKGVNYRGGSLSIRVLVISGEAPIRQLLRTCLSAQGYEVLDVMSGEAALIAMASNPDLIILELELQDMNGFDVLRAIRTGGSMVPVLVLSAFDKEAQKVEAFDIGADDYVTKPFGMKELLARVGIALRHRLQKREEKSIFEVGGLSVDLVRRVVKLNEKTIKLAPKEYELLLLLVRHAGKVLTHAFIMKELWSSVAGLDTFVF